MSEFLIQTTFPEEFHTNRSRRSVATVENTEGGGIATSPPHSLAGVNFLVFLMSEMKSLQNSGPSRLVLRKKY